MSTILFQSILLILSTATITICIIGIRKETEKLKIFLQELNNIQSDFLQSLHEMSEKNDKNR